MNNYHNHQELIKRFKLLATRELPQMRIFDRTVGLFYAKRINGGIIDYTPISINKKGMADAYALYNAGQYGLIHIEIEFKTGKAVQNEDQKIWENFINNMNGFYLLIRDEKQGIKNIKDFLLAKGYSNGNWR